MSKSYVAVYWSTDPKRNMLGGVACSTSSRFSHAEDAQNRLDAAIEVHQTLTPPLTVAGEVRQVDGRPEIVRHCDGAAPQAIGGVCSNCRRVIPRDA